jgi:hypothetical protein
LHGGARSACTSAVRASVVVSWNRAPGAAAMLLHRGARSACTSHVRADLWCASQKTTFRALLQCSSAIRWTRLPRSAHLHEPDGSAEPASWLRVAEFLQRVVPHRRQAWLRKLVLEPGPKSVPCFVPGIVALQADVRGASQGRCLSERRPRPRPLRQRQRQRQWRASSVSGSVCCILGP